MKITVLVYLLRATHYPLETLITSSQMPQAGALCKALPPYLTEAFLKPIATDANKQPVLENSDLISLFLTAHSP